MRLDIPQTVADGRQIVVEQDFYNRLHNGDASVGWSGDARLAVYMGPDSRLEIWRDCEDGEMRMIMRGRPGLNMLDTQALRVLAEHDSRSRRQYDAAQETITHNERLMKSREDKNKERYEEAHDALHAALRKDLGAHIGLTSKKYF